MISSQANSGSVQITGTNFWHPVLGVGRPIGLKLTISHLLFGGLRAESTIHLESAAFVFHMSRTTPESSGHREPRVLSPSNGFWLAPSANQNRRPQHAGVPDTPRALLTDRSGACLLQWKVPTF